MAEVNGKDIAKIFFNKENGFYEVFSDKGEPIRGLIDVKIESSMDSFVTATIKLLVNVVNESPSNE